MIGFSACGVYAMPCAWEIIKWIWRVKINIFIVKMKIRVSVIRYNQYYQFGTD